MLILHRRLDEKIIIGNGLVTITVTEIGNDHVRLGFEAPRELLIYREEIQRRIEGEAVLTQHDTT